MNNNNFNTIIFNLIKNILHSRGYGITHKEKDNFINTDYPKGKFKLIEGKVEETIPKIMPEKISLLRLDTDWYGSTKHEMENLFPLLEKNGVLIVDDYGHWAGCKEAIDEYIKENNITILLNRIDNTGRIAIKL